MTPVVTGSEALKRLFAAVTEQTFQVELGLADPPLTDYLVGLLVRFIRTDAVFRVRDINGQRLHEVAEMLMEADQRTAKPRREIHRHIGDFTLFFSGLYPEALPRLRSAGSKDHLLDYSRQGKESYYIASTFDDDEYRAEAPVLRRLSQDFDMCRHGLNRVRREIDNLPELISKQSWSAEQN